jgi:AraC-like DNA-binding protein
MEPILDEVYKTDVIEKKVELLDEYFLSKYTGFKASKIEEAIQTLLQSELKYSVEELANELDVSRKTLYRLFQKHQNCSAIDYIKLIQFRKSIDTFQNSQDKTTLTELALNTEYYDQADFIHHFKKLTGFNPKPFFKGVSDLGKEGTYWTFS